MPPGANGTTHLIGFDGHACALADRAATVAERDPAIQRDDIVAHRSSRISRCVATHRARALPRALSSMPTDSAAASRSAHVLSSIGMPVGEPRRARCALDVARRQHGLAPLRRRRRLHPIDEALRFGETTPPAVVHRRRDVDRQHVVAQDRVVGIRAAPGRHRAGEQIGEDRQPRALVRADGEQRAAIVEVLRLGRRPAVPCRRSSLRAPARPCSARPSACLRRPSTS